MNKKDLILDLHIPFGITRIKGNDFMQIQANNDFKNAYLLALMEEIKSYTDDLKDYQVKAIHLSGGAATVMNPDLLGKLINCAKQFLPIDSHAEISFDALPNTICTPSLTGISNGKPNRVQLMAYSLLDEDLQELFCPFNVQDISNSFLYLQKFHLNNVSINLTYGIPHQTVHNFLFNIKSCVNMKVPHISLSPYYDNEIDIEAMQTLFAEAEKYLIDNGYTHYLSGKFALPGYESIFDCLYENGCEVLQLGLGGCSYFDGFYIRNTNNLQIYVAAQGDYQKLIAETIEIDEKLSRNRMNCSAISTSHGVTHDLNNKDSLLEKGYVKKEHDAYVLTTKGHVQLNEVKKIIMGI